MSNFKFSIYDHKTDTPIFPEPIVKQIVDCNVYTFKELPNFEIRTKGNCTVNICIPIDRFITPPSGRLHITDSNIIIEALVFSGESEFVNSAVKSRDFDLSNSTFKDSAIMVSCALIKDSKFENSTIHSESAVIRNSVYTNSKIGVIAFNAKECTLTDSSVHDVLSENGKDGRLTVRMVGVITGANITWENEPGESLIVMNGAHGKSFQMDYVFPIYKAAGSSSNVFEDGKKFNLYKLWIKGNFYGQDNMHDVIGALCSR